MRLGNVVATFYQRVIRPEIRSNYEVFIYFDLIYIPVNCE